MGRQCETDQSDARGLIFALILLLAALSSSAAAQQPSSLSGTVTDQTGAVISGATITLTNGAGTKLTATSDAQGNFKFPNLQPGTYDVSATASGFKQFHSENLQLTAAQELPLGYLAGGWGGEHQCHSAGAHGCSGGDGERGSFRDDYAKGNNDPGTERP